MYVYLMCVWVCVCGRGGGVLIVVVHSGVDVHVKLHAHIQMYIVMYASLNVFKLFLLALQRKSQILTLVHACPHNVHLCSRSRAVTVVSAHGFHTYPPCI